MSTMKENNEAIMNEETKAVEAEATAAEEEAPAVEEESAPKAKTKAKKEEPVSEETPAEENAGEEAEAAEEKPEETDAVKASDEAEAPAGTEAEAEEAEAPSDAEPAKEEKAPEEEPVVRETSIQEEKGETVAVSRDTARRRNRSAITEYARGEEMVLGADGQEKQSVKVEEFSETLINLSISMRADRVMRGVLASVERFQGGMVAGVIWYGEFKIYIEASNLLGPTYTRYKDMSESESYAYALSGRLGSEVSFVVHDINPAEKYAAGDHQKAAEINRRRFYLRNDATGHPPVREGRIVEAKVLSARRYGVILDILGFEKRVPVTSLSYTRLEHSGQEFHPGDSVEVKIMSITYENGDVKDVEVSAREIKSNPYRKAVESIVPRCSYTGTIRRIDERAVFVTINVSGTEVTCYCQFPRMAIKINSEVIVQVDGKGENDNRVWGRVLRTVRY